MTIFYPTTEAGTFCLWGQWSNFIMTFFFFFFCVHGQNLHPLSLSMFLFFPVFCFVLFWSFIFHFIKTTKICCLLICRNNTCVSLGLNAVVHEWVKEWQRKCVYVYSHMSTECLKGRNRMRKMQIMRQSNQNSHFTTRKMTKMGNHLSKFITKQ